MVLFVSNEILSACYTLWLKQYIKKNNLTQLQAAMRLNVSSSTIQHILKGRRKPSLALIRLTMGHLKLDYNKELEPFLNEKSIVQLREKEGVGIKLLSSEEVEKHNAMMQETEVKSIKNAEDIEQRRQKLKIATFDPVESNVIDSFPLVKVPLFDAGAGEPSTFRDDWRSYDFSDDVDFVYVSEKDASMGAFGVKVAGSSMAPTVEQGDVVIVMPSRQIENGKIVLACWPGTEADPGKRLIKRFKDDGRGYVVLYSDNSDYEPIILAKKELKQIVFFRVTRLVKEL